MAIRSTYLQSDGTEKVYTSARQEGTLLYFTGSGDDIENGIRGAGPGLILSNNQAAESVSVECQFIDDVYIKDVIIMWEDAIFGDRVSMEIVLPANQPMPADDINGNADIVDGTIQYITASQTPDATWVGAYYLFPMDYIVTRFVNGLNIMGTNTHGLSLESSDTSLIPNIFKIRITCSNSITPNPNIQVSATMELYREKTV